VALIWHLGRTERVPAHLLRVYGTDPRGEQHALPGWLRVDGARDDRHEYGERYGDAADPWAGAAEVTLGRCGITPGYWLAIALRGQPLSAALSSSASAAR
jgi:hypothetical protein